MSTTAEDAWFTATFGVNPATYAPHTPKTPVGANGIPGSDSEGSASPGGGGPGGEGLASVGAKVGSHSKSPEDMAHEVAALAKQVADLQKQAAAQKQTNATQKHVNVEQGKTDILLVAATALQDSYVQFSLDIKAWADAKKAQIAAMKPHQTPTGGGMFLKIAQQLEKVALTAFPEFAIVKYVGKALDVGEKIEAFLDKKDAEEDADSSQEVKIAQANCNKELDDLVTSTMQEMVQTHGKIEAAIAQKVLAAKDSLVTEMDKIGKSQYQEIRKFLADNFDIRRGAEADPAYVGKLTTGLNQTFNKWAMNDYKTRHIPKLMKDSIGTDSNADRFMGRLLALYMEHGTDAMPEILKRIDAAEATFEKDRGLGIKFGYEKQFRKIVKQLNDGYAEVFQ